MLRSSPSSHRLLLSVISTNTRRASQSLLFHRPWSVSSQRLASSSSATKKPSSWRGTFARWGLAIGAVYFYSTSSIFAEQPPLLVPSEGSVYEAVPQTLESITDDKRRRQYVTKKKDLQPQPKPMESEEKPSLSADQKDDVAAVAADPAQLEAEADQQGAFNPETGEINWDCPCLGGMAHGPCGEEFKAAFSCFVFSQEDPKGMDCIDNFKDMQECFRKYPDVYGAELEPDDGEEGSESAQNGQGGEAEEIPDATKAATAAETEKPRDTASTNSEDSNKSVDIPPSPLHRPSESSNTQ